ncbi:hypothetical protein [Prolixibacter denitrificans]|uniref:Membrane protein n=1 Tax=Prolixibacter denitrificans TaxID=1541063 RepID=A0A2P8CIM1_9BACT|nr:hypothetical protein [Prolixibacter denitrificans]PSK84782.1 hypothetical protein CLV93_102573 [Prolixibacter denitrificans]GET20947.1 membrane protein [Prolixibacter denitrificans]
MSKTIRIVATVVVVFVTSVAAMAQQNNDTSSPYSRYGLGKLRDYGQGRSSAMGGIGIGTRFSDQINTANPASYTAIDSMTFLMDFGLSSRHTEFKSATSKNGDNNTNLSNIDISFPITHWWATVLGIMPYSDKGYQVNLTSEVEGNQIATDFNGKGTLTKVFWGNGFNITPNFSLGFNAWYLFGTLSDNIYRNYLTDPNMYDYSEVKSLMIHDYGFNLGVQYHFKTKSNNQWVVGGTFEPSQKYQSKYTLHQEKALFRGTSNQITDTLTHIEDRSQLTKLPVTYGAGVSYVIKNKITLGADYYHQSWSQATVFGQTPSYLTDRNRYSAGVEWNPNQYSIRSYWNRAYYRMGMFYENSYLYLNGTQINSYGMTFGIGLPLSRSRSTLNLSAEFGRLGTTSNNLLKEDYAKLTLHFLLNERWFIKRKFD